MSSPETKSTSRLDSIAAHLKRGAIGFVAGLMIAWFTLKFIGILHGHTDLSQPELDKEYRGRWIALGIACGVAACAMFGGRIPVSRFWLWFMISFGVISVIPFWPHKDGSLLPFATPYVNFGFEASDARLLAVHVSISFAVAAIVHRVWPVLR